MTKQLSTLALMAIVGLACFGVRAQESSRDVEERLRKLAAEKQQRKQALEKKSRDAAERLKPLMSYSVEDLQLAISLKVRETYDGARVISDEDEPRFLGVIADEFDTDSIFNEFGRYGNPFALYGIWNEFGSYGGQFASKSPFNSFTSTPPLLLKKGKVISRLTVNRQIADAVDPNWLKSVYSY
jgi:hypothetical protein